jgi:hypothetical protein
MEYPKTENLLKRDEETHKLILGEYRERSFEQVGKWHVTEKIDGTNIRLVLDAEGDISVRGRSDAAQLPAKFTCEAFAHFPEVVQFEQAMRNALRVIDPGEYARGMIVYGEGYGPGIQNGGHYAERKALRIFDVLTLADDRAPLWRPWADVEVVADILGLKTAPVFGTEETTEQVYDFVKFGVESVVAYEEKNTPGVVAEGIVARTDPYLYNSRGSRVRFKLKGHDLA